MKKIFLPILMTFLFVACSKDENKVEETPKSGEQTINASANGTWVYFSFSKGEVVTVTDPANDTSWDIAFSRYNVRTNSGTSGKGKGGALFTEKTDVSAVTEAPETGYVADEEVVTQVRNPQTGDITETKDNFNTVVSGGIKQADKTGYVTYDPTIMQNGGTTPYELTKRVYVVKTADGKFVRVQFTDYLNEKNKGGYPKFVYKVADSNRKF